MAPPSLRGYIVLSIAAAVLTLGLKSAAYLLTGSVGLLSDALESCINLLAALTAYFCLWYSSHPVDATHTYGHEKIEYFSSGLEGVLIFMAGVGIIFAAVPRFYHPLPISDIGLGTSIAMVATVVNLVVGQLLIRAGRKHHSIVLEADGQHLMSDVWTSVAVVASLGLIWLTGWQMLDPIVAILVAINVGWTGLQLIVRSFNGLMDHAIDADEQRKFREAVRAELPAGMMFHALRTRQAGARRFADFHLLVPGTMSVTDAHDVAERIEKVLHDVFPVLESTIHIEPIEAAESYADNPLRGIEPAGFPSEERRTPDRH